MHPLSSVRFTPRHSPVTRAFPITRRGRPADSGLITPHQIPIYTRVPLQPERATHLRARRHARRRPGSNTPRRIERPAREDGNRARTRATSTVLSVATPQDPTAPTPFHRRTCLIALASDSRSFALAPPSAPGEGALVISTGMCVHVCICKQARMLRVYIRVWYIYILHI